MNNDKIWVIVPAAGVGARMQADRPKQYLTLEGKTVLEKTLERLVSHSKIEGVVLAIAKDDPWWLEISLTVEYTIHVVNGGAHRADSVLNALSILTTIINNNPWVMVHDAVRPCLQHNDIDVLLAALWNHDIGGGLGIPINDTVKRVNPNNEVVETLCRQGLWRASTPQMFRLKVLSQALEVAKQRQIVVTDDASALELVGFQPKMIAGQEDNIKITFPQDLVLASLYLQQQRNNM